MVLKSISNVDCAMPLFGPRHIFESILVRNILREVRNYVKPTAYVSINPAAENFKPSSSWWKKSKQIFVVVKLFVYILQNCITMAPPPAAEAEAKIIQLHFNNNLPLSSWIFPPKILDYRKRILNHIYITYLMEEFDASVVTIYSKISTLPDNTSNWDIHSKIGMNAAFVKLCSEASSIFRNIFPKGILKGLQKWLKITGNWYRRHHPKITP